MITTIDITPTACKLGNGLLQARKVRSDDDRLTLALVASQALLLAGDQVDIRVHIRGPVQVRIVEPAGTVAYNMRGDAATWTVHIDLSEGAGLTWEAEPFVVSNGADVQRSTTISLSDDSHVRLRETLIFGRTGEEGGTMQTHSVATTGNGVPLLVEEMFINAAYRTGPGTLGSTRIIDSLTCLGRSMNPIPGATNLTLATPGLVARWLGNDLHLSPLAAAAYG